MAQARLLLTGLSASQHYPTQHDAFTPAHTCSTLSHTHRQDAMEALSRQEGVHFAYVLTKEPRHVHLAPSAAAAAANGANVMP